MADDPREQLYARIRPLLGMGEQANQTALAIVAMFSVARRGRAHRPGPRPQPRKDRTVTQPLPPTLVVPQNAPADTSDLRAHVEQLQQQNDATLRQLAAQGIGVDQVGILGLRLVMLTEHLLGDMDDPRRLAFELELAQRYAEQFATASEQVARARLLQGVQLGRPQ